MYGSSWMLLRGFGAMNGFRGGAGPPATGFAEAADPSNGEAAEPFGSPRIGATGRPGVCADAAAAHANGTANAAMIEPHTPQALWRILGRAYARLRDEWIRSRSSSSWPATF